MQLLLVVDLIRKRQSLPKMQQGRDVGKGKA
jgi:hypothetical protein